MLDDALYSVVVAAVVVGGALHAVRLLLRVGLALVAYLREEWEECRLTVGEVAAEVKRFRGANPSVNAEGTILHPLNQEDDSMR